MDTTFFSLLVWNEDGEDELYNPGDMDPKVSEVIVDALTKAVLAQPVGRTKYNMQRNLDFFVEADEHMNRFEYREVRS